MPYIITTHCHMDDPTALPGVSHLVVATLEEARADTRAIALDHNSIGGAQKAMRLSEAGGTITLPDGTVIEVARVDMWTIAEGVGLKLAHWAKQKTEAEILAAYNQAQQNR